MFNGNRNALMKTAMRHFSTSSRKRSPNLMKINPRVPFQEAAYIAEGLYGAIKVNGPLTIGNAWNHVKLQCFQKCPGNYLQALLAIPRTLRMMFVHSYQSYLWNHAASMRVQNYGFHQVVLGDLVYCKEEESDKETITSLLECEDDGDDDTHIDCNLEDIPVTDLSEVKNASVKDGNISGSTQQAAADAWYKNTESIDNNKLGCDVNKRKQSRGRVTTSSGGRGRGPRVSDQARN